MKIDFEKTAPHIYMGVTALNLNIFSFRAVKNYMNLIKSFLVIFIFGISLNVVAPALAVNPSLDGLNKTAAGINAYNSQVGAGAAKDQITNKVGGIVALILSFVGIIFLILTIYAGLMWMTAQGNSGQVDKAKDLLINAIIGLVIVSAAYSITVFVGNNLVN